MQDHRRRAVAAYLEVHFAEYRLGDRYDAQTKAQVFRLSKKGERYVLVVDETFFRSQSAAEISRILQALNVADALHRSRNVRLDENGIHDCPS